MEKDTRRVAVRTYVPAYQRDRWREDADGLDMSQSEFIRTMVQAGRRDFTLPHNPVEHHPSTSTPGGNGVKSMVLDSLRQGGHLEWDELLAELAGDLEDQLDIALDELQEENLVKGRRSGYELNGDHSGE